MKQPCPAMPVMPAIRRKLAESPQKKERIQALQKAICRTFHAESMLLNQERIHP